MQHNEGEFCWIKRPYSDWHGFKLVVEYWPNYGFVSPAAATTNGRPDVIRQFLDDIDKQDFDKFIGFAKCQSSPCLPAGR